MSVEALRELAEEVTADQLWEHLARIPGPRHREVNLSAIDQTLEYLRRRFRGFRWAVVDQPCTDPTLGHGTNLVATLPGRRADSVVVIGAHHDTVPQTPGADDNGSGLAGLLELARLMSRRSWEATIQLVAFDFEETEPEVTQAPFAGSRTYVASLDSTVSIRGAFVFEMIGYASSPANSQRVPDGLDRIFSNPIRRLADSGWRGDFIAVLGNSRDLLDLYLQSATTAAPGLSVVPLEVPSGIGGGHLFRSDHVAFWEAGHPALMLTDTAEFRNPNYHQPSDTFEKLVPEFWRNVVAATLVAAGTLAEQIEKDL